MASGTSELSPVAEKVLKFSIERAGDDGLRYEDYMEGLGTVLSGITISQLSIALHQLETKGFLHPDPHGTPNRKIRVTPLGRQAMGEPAKDAEPAKAPEPMSAPAPTPTPPVSQLQPSKPEPQPVVEEVRAAPTPAPEPSRPVRSEPSGHASGDSSDDLRRRLRAVIEREDVARGLEERLRAKERELLDEEDRLAQLEKSLDSRVRSVDEKDRQLTALEDQLHEHLSSLKGHLTGVSQVNDNVQKLHEKVSASRQKRQHGA